MIKSIELTNIQSHKHTVLNFNPGVNCIIGSSNNGKSAILRGLYWCVYNRPMGIDTLCSHWNLDDKGHMKEAMAVSIVNDAGKVTRSRTKNSNQYYAKGKELNVVKYDVPFEVSATLRLSDTNIQKQLDEPFLLSKSSGEVAKYFNKSVNIDVIDKILYNADSKKRKIKRDIETTASLINELQDKKASFEWIDEVGNLINEYEDASKEFNSIELELKFINDTLNSYYEAEKKINNLGDFDLSLKIISDIDDYELQLHNLITEGKTLSNEINSYNSYLEKSKVSYDLEFKMINNILAMNDELLKQESNINNLAYAVNQFNNHTENIEIKEKQIIEYKAKLPDMCPLCHRPFNEESNQDVYVVYRFEIDSNENIRRVEFMHIFKDADKAKKFCAVENEGRAFDERVCFMDQMSLE